MIQGILINSAILGSLGTLMQGPKDARGTQEVGKYLEVQSTANGNHQNLVSGKRKGGPI